MNTSKWSIDMSAGIAKHTSGLALTMNAGRIENIDVLPPTVKTRDLPILIEEAERAYRQHKNVTKNPPTNTFAGIQSGTLEYIPKKPVLGLRKKA